MHTQGDREEVPENDHQELQEEDADIPDIQRYIAAHRVRLTINPNFRKEVFFWCIRLLILFVLAIAWVVSLNSRFEPWFGGIFVLYTTVNLLINAVNSD